MANETYPFGLAVVELFKADALKDLALIDRHIQESKEPFEWSVNEINVALNRMQGVAQMLQLPRLYALFTSLKTYFSRKLPREALSDLSIVLSAIAWIRSCLALNTKELVERASVGDEALNGLIKALSGEESGSSVMPPCETPLPQEIVKVPVVKSLDVQQTALDVHMVDLFKIDLENQLKALSDGILQLEKAQGDTGLLMTLMRAAHSLKGAARVVRLQDLSSLAHVIEDCFTAYQKKSLSFNSKHIDLFLSAIDFLTPLLSIDSHKLSKWVVENKELLEQQKEALKGILSGTIEEILPKEDEKTILAVSKLKETKRNEDEAVIRMTAKNLDKLMGLVSDAVVETRWQEPFNASLKQLKEKLSEMPSLIDKTLIGEGANDALLEGLNRQSKECNTAINKVLDNLEEHIYRNTTIVDSLYQEALQSKMQPFEEGVMQFPRMVRDVARELSKEINFDIQGKSTLVDRDILEKLEAPLGHLLRNAIDHGIENSEERLKLGKPKEGKIILQAEHKDGMLSIILQDDGKGIDTVKIKEQVVRKGLLRDDQAALLSESGLIDCLFLPGFSTSEIVTDISGRGVGLKVVKEMVEEVSGHIDIAYIKGQGSSFTLRLPLTLSLIKALIVKIANELYAFPLATIEHALLVPKEEIKELEKNLYFTYEGKNIGLKFLDQVLYGHEESARRIPSYLSIVIVNQDYGLVVDSFAQEKDLSIQKLDYRFQSLQMVSASAIIEDGSPIFILDTRQLINLIANDSQRPHDLRPHDLRQQGSKSAMDVQKKRILVVDDSITVRQLECDILKSVGYFVEEAIDGQKALDALRGLPFDLIVTDINMPVMDGIELIKAVRADPTFRLLPIIVVSYNGNKEIRQLAMDAGANVYLSKGELSDVKLLELTTQLLGS